MCFYNIPHLISTKTELCIVLCCEFFSFFCCLFTLLFHDSTDSMCAHTFHFPCELWGKLFHLSSMYLSQLSHMQRFIYFHYSFFTRSEQQRESKEHVRESERAIITNYDDDSFFGHQLSADHMKILTIFSSWCISRWWEHFHVIINYFYENKYEH